MINYPKEAIEKMGELADNSSAAFNWLIENNYRELAVVMDGLGGKDESLKWLLDNKHAILAAFLNAIWGDETAFQYLLKNKPIWAATLNASLGDKGAMQWLKKNKLDQFVKLAEKLHAKFKRESRSETEIMHKPFK
jgi:dihydrofolate reductase